MLASYATSDGLSNPNQSWSYDAAGNRNDAVTDNLNRATSLGGVSVTHDILGNRLTKGGVSYGWDLLNRMSSYNDGTNQTTYAYRGDGMRVRKQNSYLSEMVRYDGQMPFEHAETNNGNFHLTNNVIGARGIDTIMKDGAMSYPVYDAHGNMAGTLAKTANGFAFGNQRVFDPWGNIRSAQPTGDPKNRYCASLGHVQDDESSLTYMRARYYEASSGRFVSEDPSRNGANWYVYCVNRPSFMSDANGRAPSWVGAYMLLDLISVIGCALCANGLAGTLAAYEGGWTLSAVFWAGGYAISLSIGIYAGLLTGASMLEMLSKSSYQAALLGKGDELLAMADKLKTCSTTASVGHLIELSAWLGICDRGEDS